MGDESVCRETAESDATLPVLGDVLVDHIACWIERALDAEARERGLIAKCAALETEIARLRATFGVVQVGGAT